MSGHMMMLSELLNEKGELTEDILEEVVENSEITLISSEEIFLEIEQKLQEKFHWSTDRLELFLGRIRKIADSWTFPEYFKKAKEN